MNKFVGLLIVAGLVAAIYMNREKIAALRGGENAETEEGAPATPGEPSRPTSTPHPAREAQALATKLYPGLSIPNSPLNKKFVALYAEAKHSNPEMLADPNWPIKLAERAVTSLGGAPMPMPTTPGPSRPMEGSVLDRKPQPKK